MDKKSVILGLNSAGFNTSAALLVDGKPVFAVEEERLIREKRTRRFPAKGVSLALDAAGVGVDELDAVAVAWNPAINLETGNSAQSGGRARFLGEVFYNVPGSLLPGLGVDAGETSEQIIHLANEKRLHIHYVRHHASHAASYYLSPYDEAAVMTVDAFGEKECCSFSVGRGSSLEKIWAQEFPHSLGSFYSAFTQFLGFRPQSDEWKLMGASAYGDRRRFLPQLEGLVDLHDDGFALDLAAFNHYQFHRPGLFTKRLEEIVGLPANGKDVPLTDDYYDLAASAQAVFESIYFHLLKLLHKRTGLDNLVLAGGSALNSAANGKVVSATPFADVFIPPAPDDGGASLGSAQYVYHQVLGNPRDYVMRHNYLGPSFGDDEIQAALTGCGLSFETTDDPASSAAELIEAGKIIGWFQGGLEFGDRALGNRSILADPRDPAMKDRVNALIKYREGFRPFAPAILAERTDEYFEDAAATPFMEKVFPVRADKRDVIPAVTHVDGSGRLQTVSREQNAPFYDLIAAFGERTGVPIVLNTSFNVKGEAMVCAPLDAVRTFFSSGLEALVIGNCVVRKQ